VKKALAFSVIELVIVIAVLGIVAAFAMPKIGLYSQQAKESAAKRTVQILRSTIERYAAEHNGVPPGYPNNNPASPPSANFFRMQLCNDSAYLRKIPENPFNELNSVRISGGNPVAAELGGDTGWIYSPARKIIILNTAGNDSKGVPYKEY